MAPAVQDLWMLISGDRARDGRQLGRLLEGYEDFGEFDDRELQLVEALRTLRLLHYSAWLARRWDDPAFPIAFPWFNTARYWQDRILELREQIAALQEPPLVPSNSVALHFGRTPGRFGRKLLAKPAPNDTGQTAPILT